MERLPNELLLSIFNMNVDDEQYPNEVWRYACVCRRWRTLLRGDRQLAPFALPIRKLPPTGIRVEVSGDVRGGGTGGEFKENLLKDGNEPWNKWYNYTGDKQSWVSLHLPRPIRLARYDFKSANDCPYRDPCLWELRGIRPSSGDARLLHAVPRHRFLDRHHWSSFRLAVGGGQWERFQWQMELREPRDGMQLNQIQLWEGYTTAL